ncbi:MAG: dienelactone hydrolase family protein [Armatimonadota bacterium]
MKVEVGRDVLIEAKDLHLRGFLGIPKEAQGIVLFAHGSGSGRFSPRNQYVAGVLQKSGLATLLIDLLEEWESDDRRKVFDIDLLSERLIAATDWIAQNDETSGLNIGYFGASTGAAAALQAAAMRGTEISAIVSRGGRPDLASDYLEDVTAPTLLIVGGNDYPVIAMNEDAYSLLMTTKKLVIVPGATHLFEEPGALEKVAELAADWFSSYLQTD